MDTNIGGRPEIQVEEAETLSHSSSDVGEDRLKAFRTITAGEKLTSGPLVTPPHGKRRRNGLLITACSAAVVMSAAGTFWISPYNHYNLHEATTLATHVRDEVLNTPPKPAPPLAPAAELARAPAPSASPLQYRPKPPGPQATAGGDDMAEFLRLGGQAAPVPPVALPAAVPSKAAPIAANPPSVAIVLPKEPPADTATHPLPSSNLEAAHQVAQPASAHPTPAAVEAVKPVPPTPQASVPALASTSVEAAKPAPSTLQVSAPAPATPKDAVATIALLRPAPMTDQQQLQVLQLVTELGTLVRDQRSEIAQLRQDQQILGQRVDGSLTDFGRRLSLAEARGAVSAAMGVQPAPVQPANATPPQVNAVAAPPVIKASLSAPTGTMAQPAITCRRHLQDWRCYRHWTRREVRRSSCPWHRETAFRAGERSSALASVALNGW
jgi:hypothetical protein